MNIYTDYQTRKKVEELQQMIVNEEGKPISKRKLFKVMVDLVYEKLVEGEVNDNSK